MPCRILIYLSFGLPLPTLSTNGEQKGCTQIKVITIFWFSDCETPTLLELILTCHTACFGCCQSSDFSRYSEGKCDVNAHST